MPSDQPAHLVQVVIQSVNYTVVAKPFWLWWWGRVGYKFIYALEVTRLHSSMLPFIVHVQVHAMYRASGRSRKKKSNFAGFSGTNSRKKRSISREFRGNFRGQLRWKTIVKNGRFRGSFPSKFRWKAIGFALILGKFSMKLDALIAFNKASYSNMKSYFTR